MTTYSNWYLRQRVNYIFIERVLRSLYPKFQPVCYKVCQLHFFLNFKETSVNNLKIRIVTNAFVYFQNLFLMQKFHNYLPLGIHFKNLPLICPSPSPIHHQPWSSSRKSTIPQGPEGRRVCDSHSLRVLLGSFPTRSGTGGRPRDICLRAVSIRPAMCWLSLEEEGVSLNHHHRGNY